MESILSNSDYSFVATTKKITLAAPFNTLDEERILRITNLTTKAIIYDSERRAFPISVAAGVITHTYDETDMGNADKLQIIIDLGGAGSSTGLALQDWTAVAKNSIAKSAEVSLSSVHRSAMNIQASLNTTDAHTGTKFIVQTSAMSSGDEDWQDLTEFVALIGTSLTDVTEDDPLAAGSTAIALTTHGLTVLGKLLFIEDGTLSNSEIVMEVSQTANEVGILDGTTNAHALGTAIFNVAMTQNVSIPSTANRARLVVVNTYDSGGSTLNYKVIVSEVTGV